MTSNLTSESFVTHLQPKGEMMLHAVKTKFKVASIKRECRRGDHHRAADLCDLIGAAEAQPVLFALLMRPSRCTGHLGASCDCFRRSPSRYHLPRLVF